jgi:DNA-binding transcriptional regulator YiaG
LDIARRTISVKFAQKTRLLTHHKRLPLNIKMIGDWIYFMRIKKNLAPGHLAAKMGIAATLICAWERGTSQSSKEQIQGLIKILFFLLCV